MNIVLFANTGLGNEVLKALINYGVNLKLVVTRKLEGEFPYYKEQDLDKLCKQLGINVVTDINVNSDAFRKQFALLDIDLILVSSFHQIIKEHIINIPKLGIFNFHPSLLPKYRGPNPLNWVLLNAEEYTGITVHKLVKEIDAGDIILQRKYKILPLQSLGELFQQLAIISGEMTKELVDLIEKKEIQLIKQDETKKSYYKKPFDHNEANENTEIEAIIRKLRAFVPFPGMNFTYRNNKYVIHSFYKQEKQLENRVKIVHQEDKQIFIVPYGVWDVIIKY